MGESTSRLPSARESSTRTTLGGGANGRRPERRPLGQALKSLPTPRAAAASAAAATERKAAAEVAAAVCCVCVVVVRVVVRLASSSREDRGDPCPPARRRKCSGERRCSKACLFVSSLAFSSSSSLCVCVGVGCGVYAPLRLQTSEQVWPRPLLPTDTVASGISAGAVSRLVVVHVAICCERWWLAQGTNFKWLFVP